jgi:hypothetical protein
MYIHITRCTPTLHTTRRGMPPKKRQSLAVSRKKIAEERVNMEVRRLQRIEELYADAGRSSELVLQIRLAWLLEYLMLLSDPIVHDPSLLSLAIPKEYCNYKESIMYGFDIGEK